METSSSITKIAAALLSAQQKMGNAIKDAKNPFFKSKYADLNSVREATLPHLHEAGISVLQPHVIVNGKQYVRTLFLHSSGEYMAGDTEVVCAKQNDPQALGSAISYARRYGLQSMANIGAEDDDGERGSGREPAAPQTQAPPAASTSPKTSSFRKADPTPAVTIDTSNDDGWN
jgi:hypothetical protein